MLLDAYQAVVVSIQTRSSTMQNLFSYMTNNIDTPTTFGSDMSMLHATGSL